MTDDAVPGFWTVLHRRSKVGDANKSALAVYHWFVRQALTGSRVVARKPTGEEVTIETAELAALEGKGNRLTPKSWAC